MTALKLRAIGNSVGLVIPKEVLAELKVGEGDVLHLLRTKDGVVLTPFDPDVAAQVEAGREVMRQYRDTLRILAK